jgi:ribonuclease P protein component
LEKLIVSKPTSLFSFSHSLLPLVDGYQEAKSAQSENVKREFRLRRSSDFKRVWRFGKSYAHPLMVLMVLKNQEENSRIAVAAGRSVGKAVQRNRAKRIIREAIRPIISQIQSGWDIVIIGRKAMSEASLNHVQSVLIDLLHKSELLFPNNNHGNRF